MEDTKDPDREVVNAAKERWPNVTAAVTVTDNKIKELLFTIDPSVVGPKDFRLKIEELFYAEFVKCPHEELASVVAEFVSAKAMEVIKKNLALLFTES
jgi:hypothetical protein